MGDPVVHFVRTFITTCLLASPVAVEDELECKFLASQGNRGDMIDKVIHLINQADRVLVLDDVLNYSKEGPPIAQA